MTSVTPLTSPRTDQRSRILRLLINARGEWVSLKDILALQISQYGARIYELGRLGFQIKNKREGEHSAFRLISGPNVAWSMSPPQEQSAFPEFGNIEPSPEYPG